MTIYARCTKPKYAQGTHTFDTSEDLYSWLIRINSLSKGAPGKWLHALAQKGSINNETRRYHIEIDSEYYDYAIADDVARRAGLLKKRGFADVYSQDREIVLTFAQEWDHR